MTRLSRRSAHSPWLKAGILLMSVLLGVFLSFIPQVLPSQASPVTTTDRVPAEHQAGEQVYRQTCGQCHWAIPPAVFPTQTWGQLLRDPNHYGATLTPLLEPDATWLRDYLKFSSRSLREGERTPYRFKNSRYLKILHPDVELPQSLDFNSCTTCHTQAANFNFRQ